METKSRIGDGEPGVATIDGVAGEARAVAKIFAIRSTISAFAVRPAKPRNADGLAHGKSLDAFADLFDAADDLVPGNERQFRIRQFTIEEIGEGVQGFSM